MMESLYHKVHPQWIPLLEKAFLTLDPEYLAWLQQDTAWLPGLGNVLAAFNLPLSEIRYILLGESPYPRADSANGYAFWDNAVSDLWSETGLSKPVNKATSLRNWIKALLAARGDLVKDYSQTAIAAIDKRPLVKTAKDLFAGMMHKGILLLNASLVYSKGRVPYHARQWAPFMHQLFQDIAEVKPTIEWVLFGAIAKSLPLSDLPVGLVAEHPYNVSFISNPAVLHFFKPLDLLTYA